MRKHFTITISGDLHDKGLKLRAMILANKFYIYGSVSENLNQITIEAEGTQDNLDQFCEAISKHFDTEATGNTIQLTKNQPLSYFEEFIIK